MTIADEKLGSSQCKTIVGSTTHARITNQLFSLNVRACLIYSLQKPALFLFFSCVVYIFFVSLQYFLFFNSASSSNFLVVSSY